MTKKNVYIMVIFKKIGLFLIVILIMIGCSNYENIKRLKYYGNSGSNNKNDHKYFKIDGLYYGLTETNYMIINIFYKDGRFFKTNTKFNPELLDEKNQTYEINNTLRNRIWCWGAYIIVNDTIKIQRFSPGRVSFQRQIDEDWTIIENDSSIHFINHIEYNEPMSGISKKEKVLNYYMNFKHLDVKPDSMNFMMDDFKSEEK